MEPMSNFEFMQIRERIKESTENHFPYREVYPEPLADLIDDYNASMSLPKDYLAATILVASAAGIGKAVVLRLKQGFPTWASLYVSIVGKANSNKTLPVTVALNPLKDKDKQTFEQYTKLKQKYNAQMAATKRRTKEKVAEQQEPQYTPIVVSDITQEGLFALLSRTSRGVLYYADELAGMIKNFGRYNSGSDEEAMLSFWNNGSYSVMRKTCEPLVISNPVLSVIGTIQTKILASVFKNKQDNGFMDRFLWVWCEGSAMPWGDTEVSSELLKTYCDAINRLCGLTPDDATTEFSTQEIWLTPEAQELILNWQREEHVPEVKASDEETYAGALGKFDIICPRFALILQLLYWSMGEDTKDCVGVRAMQSAIILTDYFKKQTIAIHKYLYSTNPLDRLGERQRKVYDALPRSISIKMHAPEAEKLGMNRNVFKKFLAQHKDLFIRKEMGFYIKKPIE